jgi:hypothetical protein
MEDASRAGREEGTHLLAEHGGVLELGEGRHGCLPRGGLEALLCGRREEAEGDLGVGGRGKRSAVGQLLSLCLLPVGVPRFRLRLLGLGRWTVWAGFVVL